ncbi:MAG: sodium:proton antiporter NhaD [Bacteroidales bacterium]|nr:sodium:proton antiporter NhaD [Bacteroidales bacterium]MBR1957090.1 sodium:proton antiporter NhaD [Bacteroidales bacterium]
MTTAIICIFIAGYMLIAMENWTKVNKAAVSLLMAVLSWALYYWDFGASAENVSAFTKALGETSEILFFLMGAMAIVEVVDANGGFDFFRERLVSKSKVELLWKLTFITFFLSAVLDNMTTAIIMVTILDKMTSNRKDKLLYASMVILSANSGGAFSPIGDVTTIMLWVKGYISTFGVLRSLFLPSLVSVIIPAIIVSFFLKGKLETDEKPAAEDKREISRQSLTVFLIGVGGLLLVPVFRFVTGLPPFMGIMLILAVLWIVTDISLLLRKIDLSTILFFLGILSTVAVLSEIGVLKAAGNFLERVSEGNPYIVTTAIGFLSAIVDNVPLVAGCMGMYDVIASGAGAELYGIDGTFWELLAYAGGIGGSILIIGSAAGVVVMGLQDIPFGWYLRRFSWIACIGFLAGILTYWLQSIVALW